MTSQRGVMTSHFSVMRSEDDKEQDVSDFLVTESLPDGEREGEGREEEEEWEEVGRELRRGGEGESAGMRQKERED